MIGLEVACMGDPFLPITQQYPSGTWWQHEGGRFTNYLNDHSLKTTDTAAAISVDFQERLPQSLQAAAAMVLRLGKGHFAVVGTENKLDDFFLHDEVIFGRGQAQPHPLNVDSDTLAAYDLLPKTERTLVNLAFAAGLMQPALGLDRQPPAAPATGSSTYRFRFRPHSMLPDHLDYDGQVEIDAVFVGRRNNQPALFVIEAKVGAEHRTLAKHKLLYPVLALYKQLNGALPIIPVYMRIVPGADAIIYHVAECESLRSPSDDTAIDEIQPRVGRSFAVT